MLLILIGFSVAAVGTLIGVGGGFMLVPILLFLYPQASNVWISSLSMWVVAFNATSGSIAYFLKGKVHWRASVVFIVASLPGSVLGVWVEHMVSRSLFEVIFGAAMMAYSCFLFFRGSRHEHRGNTLHANSALSVDFYLKGSLISFGVGFIASFFGIGGGVVHVPLLSSVLGFPVHLATGTSHAILAVTAWFTTAVHIYDGDLNLRDPALWQLAIAALVGAQVGAYFSKKVSGLMILKILAGALFSVGLRLLWPTVAHAVMSTR